MNSWFVTKDGSVARKSVVVRHCVPQHEAEHMLLGTPLESISYRDANCHRWNHELHTAIIDDDLEKVKEVLLDGKAGLEDLLPPGDELHPPIVCASIWNRPQIVQFLLESGADPYAGSEDEKSKKFTAADVAGSHGFPDIMKVLLKQPDFDPLRSVASDGMVAIHRACFGGLPEHTELLRVILNAGVNPNALTRKGSTPLMIAEMYERHESVALLQSHIRKINDEAIDAAIQREWDRLSGRPGDQPSLEFVERIMQDMYRKAQQGGQKVMMVQLRRQLENRGLEVDRSLAREL